MWNHKPTSRKVIAAQTAYTRAHTSWLWAVVVIMAVGASVLFAPFIGIIMLFGSTALGLVLLVLATVALTTGCIWLGSRMNDKSQENFIAMTGHLKSALTASVREDTRTWGVYERAQIEIEKKLAQEQIKQQPPSPSADQLQREAWAAQFVDNGTVPIEGEWHTIDDEEYVMDDVI